MSHRFDYTVGLFSITRSFYSRLFRTRWDSIYVLLVLVCGGFVYLQGLERPLGVWDEPLYMITSQFTVQHGYWIIPYVPYNGFVPDAVGVQPFLIKPPLAIWFQAFSMELLGVTATAARLPAVGFTLLTAVLTYYFGRTIYTREAGFAASIVLLTTQMIFAGHHGGRTAAMDMQMVFFGTLAVYTVFLGVRRDYSRTALFPVAGIALGAAILTKGFGAGVFVLITLPLIIIYWRAFLTREGILAAGLAAAIPLTWFTVAGLLNGNVLVAMLYEQVIGRITGSSVSTYPATFEFMKHPYFRNAPEKFDPWFYLLLAALVTVPLGIYRRRGRSRIGSETLFLCWWWLGVFGFFVVTGNHGWYLMPIVIPMGLLCGRLIDRGLRPSPEAAGLAVGLYLTLMNSPLVGRGIRFATGGLFSPSPPVRFALVVWCLGILIAVVYREQWVPAVLPRIELLKRTRVVKQLFIVSLLVFVFLQVPMADMDTAASTDQKQLGQQFYEMTPPNATVYIHPSAQRAIYTFVFYAQRPLQEATLEELNTNPEIRYALVNQSVIERLDRPHHRIGTITAPWFGPLVLLEFNDIDTVRSQIQIKRWQRPTLLYNTPEQL